MPSAPHVLNPTEMIVLCHAGQYRRPAAGRRGDILPAEQRDWSLGLWSFAGANTRLRGHPAAFPEELPRRLIKLYSYPEDVVADPFLGSGTTAVAAARLGRRVRVDLRHAARPARLLGGERGDPPSHGRVRGLADAAGRRAAALGLGAGGRRGRELRGIRMSRRVDRGRHVSKTPFVSPRAATGSGR